jgi:CheY-specific phosphatase CheX
MKTFAVTGTFHGSIVYAKTEGEARRIFHIYYNGESITNIREIKQIL